MPELLHTLGFDVNERTYRCACLICGSTNRSCLSWTPDGKWHCFRCGRGGDKFTLIEAVRNCGFKESLHFLAGLAGVEISHHRPRFAQLHEHRQNQARLDVATEKLRLLEAHLRARYREEILDLEQIKDLASGILKAKHEAGKCDDVSECAWKAIALVNNWLPRVAAGYTILSFANAKERARFALHPEQAEEIIDQTIHRGFVMDDKVRFCEVLT